MGVTPSAVDEHIQSLPPDRREVVQHIHEAIRGVAPDLPVKLWQQRLWGGIEVSIIGYGEYTQTYRTGRVVRWFLVGLASQKNYLSLYINAVEDQKYLPELFKEQLGKVKVGKSCITFKKLDDLNLDVLTMLVRKAVQLVPQE